MKLMNIKNFDSMISGFVFLTKHDQGHQTRQEKEIALFLEFFRKRICWGQMNNQYVLGTP